MKQRVFPNHLLGFVVVTGTVFTLFYLLIVGLSIFNGETLFQWHVYALTAGLFLYWSYILPEEKTCLA